MGMALLILQTVNLLDGEILVATGGNQCLSVPQSLWCICPQIHLILPIGEGAAQTDSEALQASFASSSPRIYQPHKFSFYREEPGFSATE